MDSKILIAELVFHAAFVLRQVKYLFRFSKVHLETVLLVPGENLLTLCKMAVNLPC